MPNIAVLTSGGDSPGMNAAVMSVARASSLMGMNLIGIKRGFNGLIGKSKSLEDDIVHLTLDQVLDIADLPGTYLRTARCLEFKQPEYQDKAVKLLHDLDVEGVVVIGGDGSFQGAQALARKGIPTIGIPGTIDNDLGYTELSLGFDTAVNVCVEAVRAIRATSRSHDRASVVEVMGRNCGDIALNTALSTGSEIVIVPEMTNWSVDEIAHRLNALVDRGNQRASIIVAEGAYKTMAPFDVYEFMKDYPSGSRPVFPGSPMDAYFLSRVVEHKVKKTEVRSTVIGYTQRGSQPTARDAAFAFEAGVVAVNLLRHGESNRVVGVHNGKVFHMDIESALQIKPSFNRRMFNMVNAL